MTVRSFLKKASLFPAAAAAAAEEKDKRQEKRMRDASRMLALASTEVDCAVREQSEVVACTLRLVRE